MSNFSALLFLTIHSCYISRHALAGDGILHPEGISSGGEDGYHVVISQGRIQGLLEMPIPGDP